MLRDFLTEDMIEVGFKAANWEASVEKACDLLTQGGMCQKSYFNNILKAVEQYGPYFVIAPQIAFAHANSQGSVLRDCISLVQLAEPVKFGHMDNDPVHLVFVFGSAKAQQHLEMLRDLSNMLCEPQNQEKLMNAKTKNEILNIVNNY